MWFTGIGAGGPAVTAGTMLLLNKIAMALFVGLGPLFILCLLFEQTKQLFGKWLYYGIGTMFSLAVLSVMVTLAMDMVIAVAGSFWAGDLAGDLMGDAGTEGITSRAMQQGGLGLILTMLIISAPPMAASFFQGTLASFNGMNAFVGGGAGTSQQRQQQLSAGGYSPPPSASGRQLDNKENSDGARVSGADYAANQSATAYSGTKAVAQQDMVKTNAGSGSGRGDSR